jgi:hypothetical protein
MAAGLYQTGQVIAPAAFSSILVRLLFFVAAKPYAVVSRSLYTLQKIDV